MVIDPEKADLEVSQHRPQVLDVQVQRSGTSTVRVDESKKGETDEDWIHSRPSSSSIEPVTVEEAPPRNPKSRSSSLRSRSLTVVPRSKRRGLLGRLSIIPEVERPYDYRNKTKWLITMIVALAAAAAPLGSAIFYREFTLSFCSIRMLTIPFSGASSTFKRLAHHTNNHQLISCNVYALNEYLSTLVVIVL